MLAPVHAHDGHLHVASCCAAECTFHVPCWRCVHSARLEVTAARRRRRKWPRRQWLLQTVMFACAETRGETEAVMPTAQGNQHRPAARTYHGPDGCDKSLLSEVCQRPVGPAPLRAWTPSTARTGPASAGTQYTN